jgi:thiosulfate/3-mercaptopyruvate sulfurtransferase
MGQPKLPLLVEPDVLESALGGDNLLVVDVSGPDAHAERHVPGAVNLDYAALIGPRPPAMGLIADADQLSEAFSAIGMTADSHVVAYDGEGGGRASRLLWTLDAVGHGAFSLLNGGMQAWAGEGHATETGVNQVARSDYRVTLQGDGVIADKSYIRDRLEDSDVVIFDVRSAGEFAGDDVRAARGGHIPGAVNMDWTMAIDRDRNLRFKSEDALRDMLGALGVTPDKEVITHCQTHHRSAHTYIVLKSLGFSKIRGYDGSWSDWGNDPDMPVES